MCLELAVDIDTQQEDVTFEIHPTKMSLEVKGESVLEGMFPEGCRANVIGRFQRRKAQALACFTLVHFGQL